MANHRCRFEAVVARDGLDALFDQIMHRLEYPLRAIIYLSCFTPLTTEALTVSSLEEQVLESCGNLLRLVQALVKHQLLVRPASLRYPSNESLPLRSELIIGPS